MEANKFGIKHKLPKAQSVITLSGEQSMEVSSGLTEEVIIDSEKNEMST